MIQQPGAPIGQAAVPQLFSIGPFRQFGALAVGQAGAANGVPQQQGQLPQLPNGVSVLYQPSITSIPTWETLKM